MSLLQVSLALANQQNFVCDHNGFCQLYCHKRLLRSCARLSQALGEIYGCSKIVSFSETKNLTTCNKIIFLLMLDERPP